jgi:hypothetical protein
MLYDYPSFINKDCYILMVGIRTCKPFYREFVPVMRSI